MKKLFRIFALVLAVMMMATMATACKEEDDDEDFGTVDVGGKTGKDDNEDGDNSGSGDTNSGDSNSGDTNSGDTNTNTGDNNGGSGNNNGGSGNNNGGSGNTNNGGSGNNNGDSSNPDKTPIYDPDEKYSADNNPLVMEAKKPNTGVEPSFNIDTTGFVKNNIKLADLKGKKLTLMTSILYDCFTYLGPKGETLGEWKWFEALKSTYGLSVSYIKSDFTVAPKQIVAYMNAGKPLDLYNTHNRSFPNYLAFSQSIEPYINMQNSGNSPGVSEMTMKQTRWGGSYRAIAPIGAVNFLYYNKSLVEEFRLKDPHTLWQQGNWNWDTWRDFIHSVPSQTSSGEKLFAHEDDIGRSHYSWPQTNGVTPIAIDIDNNSKTPNLINNWKNEKVRDAWNFYATTVKSVNYGGSWGDFWSGRKMMTGVYNLQNDLYDDEYCQTHKFDWVPYPAATTSTGRCIVNSYGYMMCIPKKVKTQSNIPYAVKFAELWATRFTEAIYDYFATAPWLKFDYAHRKELFEFSAKNTYFGLNMDAFTYLSGDEHDAMYQFWNSQYKPEYNILTEATKVENLVEKAIKYCIDISM